MSNANDILVGVDGSTESNAALTWAVGEAAARGCGLNLVHVCDSSAYALWTTTRTLRAGLRALSQPIVDDALATVRTVAPTLAVRGRVLLGSPARCLITLSGSAPLIVVGRQGRGALAPFLPGSVTQRLMAHAGCPVIAVPVPAIEPLTDASSGAAQAESPDSGTDASPETARAAQAVPIERVVVAIGDRPTGHHALSFAVSEAALRSVPLMAVHAWLVPAWPQPEPDGSTTDPAFEIGREQGLLNSELAAHRGPLAAADVHGVIRSGRATQVLTQFCRSGDLLVLGQHRHARFVPATLGPVVSAMVHQPPCAIAIVPEPVDQPDQSPSAPVALVAVP